MGSWLHYFWACGETSPIGEHVLEENCLQSRGREKRKKEEEEEEQNRGRVERREDGRGQEKRKKGRKGP
jgi:hypothetical protein